MRRDEDDGAGHAVRLSPTARQAPEHFQARGDASRFDAASQRHVL